MSYGAVYLINGSTTYTTAEILALIAAKAASSHAHAISDITGLSAALGDAGLTGAEIVTALNTQLGSTVWQSNSWGTITGTLSSQTDLQSALNAKAASSHTHTLSQITDVTVTSDMVSIPKGLRPGLYDDLVTPPVGTIIESSNDGHLYWVHRDGSVHLLCDSGGYGGVAWGAITGTLSDQTDLQTALDAKQPLNANLTGISSISTTGYALIVATVSGMSVMTTSDAVLQLLDDTSTSAMRTTLGLGIGTNVQAYDAELAAIAGLTSAADRLPYFTGSGTAALATCTAFARTLLDDTSANGMQSTLGLVIGDTVQAHSSMLWNIANVAQPFDAFLYYTNLGVATSTAISAFGRSFVAAADAAAGQATLGLAIGINVQAFNNNLNAIAGLATAADKGVYFTGSGTAATFTITAAARSLMDDTSAAGMQSTLGLVIGTNVQAYDAELAALAGLTSVADRVPYFTGSGTAAIAPLTSLARSIIAETTSDGIWTDLGAAQFDTNTADVFRLSNGSTRQTLELLNYETSSTALEGLRIKAKASASWEIGTYVGSVSGVTRGIAFGTYAVATPTVLEKWAEFNSSGSFLVYTGTHSLFRYIDTTAGGNLILRKARGTIAAPTAALTGDQIGRVDVSGYGATGFNGGSGSLLFIAAEDFTDTVAGTRATITTTPIGSLVPATRISIGADGNVAIGNAIAPLKKLVIEGNNSTGAENNTLRFHDLDTTCDLNQVLGKTEYWSADVTAPGAGIKAWHACISDAAGVPNAAFVWATDTAVGTPTEKMRISANGNVGIGTSTPGQLLEVSAADNPHIRITNTDTTATVAQLVGALEFYGSDTDLGSVRPVGGLDCVYVTTLGDTELQFSVCSGAQTVGAYLTKEGWFGVGVAHSSGSTTSPLDIWGNCLRIRNTRTPASATAAGNQGEWCNDGNYIYICTATNTWKRVAIATW